MATLEVTKRFFAATVGTEDNWNLKKGSSKVDAVNPGEALNHDDLGSFIRNADLSTDKQSFKIDRNFPDSMGTVNEVRVHCRANPNINNASIKLGVALTAGPTWVLSATIDLGTGGFTDESAALARPGGGGWTETDFHDITFQFSVEPDSAAVPDIMDVTSMWVEIDYLPTDESAGAIPPEFPSRQLRRSRIPLGIINAEMRADALDIDLMEDFEVVHSDGDHPSGSGWEDNDWGARRFRCIDNDLNPNRMIVRPRGMDLTDMACMFWHTGIAPYTFESDENYPDGPAILHPGVTETFTRAGKAYILNAGSVIVELNNNIKRIGPDGILIESVASNYVINSAFFNGFTGWTRVPVGRTSLDTGNILYDGAIATGLGGTNQSAKLDYVDGVGDSYVERVTVQSFNNGELVAFSLWHKDSNINFPPRIAIENISTGNWYNAGSQTWGGSLVINTLTGRTNWGRSVLVFTNDVTTSTLRIRVYSPSSGGSGDTNTWAGQVQLEWKADGQQAATSPIPTFSAAVTRQGDILKFSNDLGRRIWPVECGTLIVRLKWLFNGPIISTAGTPSDTDVWGIPIYLVYHDANNWAYLQYYITEEIWFIIKAGGTKRIAKFTSFSSVNEDVNVFVARWTSGSGGELDLPSRTMSVFVDGVKGSVEAQAAADMSEVDTGSETFWGPGKSGFGATTLVPETLASYSHVEVIPRCLTDEEVKARP